MKIDNEIYDFLFDLRENNYREWFHTNKDRYQTIKQKFETFAQTILESMQEIDSSLMGLELKQCTYRIQRDIRFSPNKMPYKTHLGIYMAKNGGKKSIYSGYYFQIGTEESFLGGGIYMPTNQMLKVLRKEIFYSYEEFSSILEAPLFKKFYNGIEPYEKLKIGPKDFPKDFEGIDILKNKHFCASHFFTKDVACKDNFSEVLLEGFQAVKPMNDFFNFTIDHQSNEDLDLY